MIAQNSTWREETPWHHQDQQDYSIYSETGERTRRRHQKSKGGCLYCKQRHIKCSEERPACSACRRLGRTCQYPRLHARPSSDSCESSAGEPGEDSSLYTASVKSQVLAALASTDDLDPDLIEFSSLTRQHALEALNHFVQCDQSWLKTPKIQHVMQRHAIDQVLGQPYLLHAVLAVSTAHLATLRANDQSYNIASSVHWQRSLRAYSDCLNNDIETKDVDALYFTSHIHSILAFICVDEQYSPETWQLPAWIASMRGIHVLMDIPHVANRLREGVWQPMVHSCELWHQRIRDRMTILSQEVPSQAIYALTNYCSSLPQQEADFYRGRIGFLRVLEQCSFSPNAINAVASFVSKAPPEYITKLKNGEEMALILLLYWSQLFSRVRQWWLTPSARREHSKLYAYIWQKTGNERIRTLLNTVVAMGNDITN